MKVRARHQLKHGGVWYGTGDIFETDASEQLGDTVEVLEAKAQEKPEAPAPAKRVRKPKA